MSTTSRAIDGPSAPANHSTSGISFNLRLIHWILRLAVLGCFVGHGAFGIITKADWLPFFHVVGIPDPLAYQLMPLIGVMDITIGIVCFFRPMRAVLVWATFWCVLTALMRPLAGMSWFELIERAGNYGAPLALLLTTYAPSTGFRSWFSSLKPASLNPQKVNRLILLLMIGTALLLLGHAGFGLVLGKESLAKHYQALGLNQMGSISIVRIVGFVDLIAVIIILVIPFRIFLVAIALWKFLTELLYPLSGAPVWETVERAGSYALPIVLALLITERITSRRKHLPVSTDLLNGSELASPAH